MARQQVQYDGQAEALRTVAAPKVSAVQARVDPRASSGFQLAEALGAAGPQIEQYKQAYDKRQEQEAMAFAMSMPVNELNKMVREGKLPVSKSPVFVATVQNVAGQNTRDAMERDVLSKIERGELSFPDAASLDNYLTEQRNNALAGQSQFAVAGFDKGWNQFRQKVMDANTKLNDKKAVEEGIRQGSEALRNITVAVTSPEFQGTDADRAKYIMDTYAPLRRNFLLRDDAAKSAWEGTLLELARTGNKALVKELLDSRLPDNGPAVRNFIGDGSGSRAVQFQEIADREYEQLLRKNEAALKKAQDDVDIKMAQADADLYVAGNRGGEIKDFTTRNGTKVTAEDLATGAIERQIAANPNMPFVDQVRLYAVNGSKNKGWQREFKTAVTSIGEIGMTADGKPAGTLLPGTEDILNRFALVRQVSEQYAQEMAGGEDNYKILRRIQALRDLGTGGDASQAAAIVNQITRRNIPKETWGKIQEQVVTVMDEIRNPGIFTKRFWGEVFRGEFGEGNKNFLPIQSTLKDLAETLLAAGIARDGDEAVAKVGEYLSNPAVITQINNTLYLNKDLPKMPPGEEGKTAQWMTGFMENVIGGRLKARGMGFNMGDLTLIPQEGGQGSYTVALKSWQIPNEDNRGLMTVTRKEIETWINSEIELRRTRQADQANETVRKRNQPAPTIGDFMVP